MTDLEMVRFAGTEELDGGGGWRSLLVPAEEAGGGNGGGGYCGGGGGPSLGQRSMRATGCSCGASRRSLHSWPMALPTTSANSYDSSGSGNWSLSTMHETISSAVVLLSASIDSASNSGDKAPTNTWTNSPKGEISLWNHQPSSQTETQSTSKTKNVILNRNATFSGCINIQ